MVNAPRPRRRRRNRNRNAAKRNGNGNGNANGNPPRNATTPMRKKITPRGGTGLSNYGALARPVISKVFTEAGTDYLGPLTVNHAPTTTADRILKGMAISPSAFPGTRLTQLSNLWERYRFRRFRLRWVPAVPKTLACQLIVYQDTDPLDDPAVISNADALVRQATAQAGSRQFNFINATAIDLARRTDDQLYYTGPLKENERFSQQGNFWVIQVTDPVDMNGAPLTADITAGSLYVDWVCEFQIAQINPIAAETASTTLPLSSSGIQIKTAEAVLSLSSGDYSVGTITLTEPTLLDFHSGRFGFTAIPETNVDLFLRSAASVDTHLLSLDVTTDTFIRVLPPDTLTAVQPGTYLTWFRFVGALTSCGSLSLSATTLSGTVPTVTLTSFTSM